MSNNTSEFNVIPLGKGIGARLTDDKEAKSTILQRESEIYQQSGGSYRKFFFPPTDEQLDSASGEALDLTREEVVYYNLIWKKLEERERLHDTSPVIVVDIGGMFAATWCRLAVRYQDEVKQGKVRFVVTNLNLDNETIDAAFEKKAKGPEPFGKKVEDAFRAGRSLVEWFKGDVGRLWEEYQGMIDIAHEHMAFVHSSIPDLDFPVAMQTLKDNGIFISSSEAPHMIDSDYRYSHQEEIWGAWNQAVITLDSKYHRLLQGRTMMKVWSPDKEAEQYFINPRVNDAVITYEKH